MRIEQRIKAKITEAFSVQFMQLDNESHMHNVPENAETHFKLVLVTEDFDKTSKVARHQKIYRLLSEELEEGVHALALHTYTPQEWQRQPKVLASPNCMGANKK